MKKLLYTFFILCFSLLGLCSCNLINTKITTNKNKINYSMASSDFTTMDTYLISTKHYIDVSYDDFYTNYYNFSVYYFYLYDTISETYVNYGINGDKTYLEEYQNLYEKFQNYSKERKNIFKSIASSTFRTKFFEGYSDEEIEDIISDTPDEVYTLEVEINAIQQEFKALSRSQMVTSGPSYIVKIVEKCNKLAKLEGYDNYLDYAYDSEYGRYYTYNDSLTYAEYIKKYLIDYTIDIYNEYSSLKKSISTLSLSSYISASFTSNSKTLMKYAKTMGSDYYSNYKHLISDGYLYKSNSGGYSGAYTSYYYLEDEPFILIGDGYDDSYSFIHEYGHYLNARLCGWNSLNYDLAETQSMGNEMLYTSYLINNLELTSDRLEYLKVYKEYEMLYTLIECCYVNELTIACFKEDSLTEEKVVELHDEILQTYGSEFSNLFVGLSNYPYYTIVPQPCYYISYSVAALEVLDLFKISLNDFENGKTTYLNIVNKSECNSGSEWISTGLCDPFSEDSFKYLIS